MKSTLNLITNRKTRAFGTMIFSNPLNKISPKTHPVTVSKSQVLNWSNLQSLLPVLQQSKNIADQHLPMITKIRLNTWSKPIKNNWIISSNQWINRWPLVNKQGKGLWKKQTLWLKKKESDSIESMRIKSRDSRKLMIGKRRKWKTVTSLKYKTSNQL